MEDQMDLGKCFIRTRCFQLKLALNLKLAITKQTVAYLKVSGSMMKDLKVEW